MTKINYKTLYFLSVTLLLSLSSFAQNIAINEIMSSNLNTINDEDGTPQDWIELYNYGTDAVSLSGYGLTDDPTLPYKWVFPAVIMQPNSYLLVWASSKNRIIVGQPLHTNFKISASGEQLVLTNLDGILVSESPQTALPHDVSLGRQPNGTGAWLYFYTSTPTSSNSGFGFEQLLMPPTFSQNSGFFTNSFDLTLSHPNPIAVIVYTLDGSEPDINNLNGTTFQYKNVYPIEIGSTPSPLLSESYTSLQYSNPITIVDKSAQPDYLTTKNTQQELIYVPLTPVRKTTILKAKSYVNGVPSKTVSKSYFIWAEGNPYNFPVISFQTQENNLFDYNLGTYTAGVDFDTWRANNPDNPQYYRPEWCNYARSGSAWEYPINVEIFKNSVSVLNQNAGFRIHGNNSRTFLVKSLRLYADTDYEERDYFEQNLFDVPIYDAPNPNNIRFKRIAMRGNGEGGSIAYDVVFNRLMQPVYNGVDRVQPVVHFINGEYWGLSAIRDRVDQYHYGNNFNLNKDNVAIVDCSGSNCELDEGLNEDYLDYNDLQNYIISNDMANPTFYTQVTNRLDIVSYIDHMVLQIYSGTNGYERGFWKARTPENSGYGDGKWRTSVKDFESSLSNNQDWLVHWATISGSPNEAIFANLLANPEFKNHFINRFADLLNSVFLPEHFLSVVNSTFDEVTPYLAENFNRTPAANFYTTDNKQNLITWGNNHPALQRTSIKTHFGITNTVNIILNVSDEVAGFIKMNTIEVTDNTPGIAVNPYPWSGIYYKNIPVTLTAKAKEGYTFTHWSGDVSGTSPQITFTPDVDKQIQANFVLDTSGLSVAYFWYLSDTIPNNLPLQSLNATFSTTNSTGSLQFQSCLVGYPFTSTDPNWRTASMERRNAPTPLNYFASANTDLPYNSSIMKGIQIKQPFKNGILENTLRLVFSTVNLQQIKISFAVETDGAATGLIFDYWNGNQWINTGISNPTAAISAGYALITVDLSAVISANNQSELQFRIRFEGENLFLIEGKRVQFNNIAIQAQQNLSYSNPIEDGLKFSVYPNPASSKIQMMSNEPIMQVDLYNLYGQRMLHLTPNSTSINIDIQNLQQGIYLLKARSEGLKEKVVKIIKK